MGRTICKNDLVLFLFSYKICFGYLLESPHRGDSNKHSNHVFREVLNTMFLLNFLLTVTS